LTQDENFIG